MLSRMMLVHYVWLNNSNTSSMMYWQHKMFIACGVYVNAIIFRLLNKLILAWLFVLGLFNNLKPIRPLR